MRAHIFAALALTALILAPAAVVAHDGRADDARAAAEERKAAAHANGTRNETRDDNDTRDGRPAAVAAFHAALRALHASWHENMTQAREGCHAQTLDKENATRADRVAHAHCVRDAHKALHAAYRADLRELRAEMRAAMREA